VVATTKEEDARLDPLHERGVQNGLNGLTMLTAAELRAMEPHVRGIRALLVPEAGTTSYGLVAEAMAHEIRQRGGTIEYGARVIAISHGAEAIALVTPRRTVRAAKVMACAGLNSDRVAVLAGVAGGARIVPFRGDYYRLRRERLPLVQRLVYNVPDPRLPFLGVHIARQIDGEVLLGPNAVLALAREGYRRRDIDVREVVATIRDRGFRRLVARHWRTGAFELARDLYKPLFLASVRRFVPDLHLRDLVPGPSGVRAQALDHDGNLVDDFAFDVIGRFLGVRNAPSPAATSSLALARVLVDRLSA
jgi:L-2-hydroxyglutarate oxidase LhgO